MLEISPMVRRLSGGRSPAGILIRSMKVPTFGFSRFRRSMEFRCSTCSHVGAGPSGLRSPPPYFLSTVPSATSPPGDLHLQHDFGQTKRAARAAPLLYLWVCSCLRPHGHLAPAPMAPERIQQQRHGIIAAPSPAHL